MKAISAVVGLAGRRDFVWLDSNFAMHANSPARGLGFDLRLDGIFTSVPLAVASIAMVNPILSDITGTHEMEMARAAPSARPDPADTPALAARVLHAGLLVPTARLDLFGLGRDYAMYHKSYIGVHDTDDLSGWQGLGGVFTSAPAAIAWNSRIDVFGVGMDHALYTRTLRGSSWTPGWQSLGGTFTSTASAVSRSATQLDIFARGADFTLRGNQSDGTTWFGWQNHGGQLASPPVAVSWGPDRIDVFAIFHDGALWHIWWDGQLWNAWESLGGNYLGEPAAVTWAPGRLDVFVKGATDRKLYHHWFENDTWSVPEVLNTGTTVGLADSPTAVSAAANKIEVFVPCDDGQIRIVTWDGASWSSGSAGAHFRMPSRYRMSVDYVRADRARSPNSDTDAAATTLTAGNYPVATRTQWIGDLGGTHPQTSQTNLLYFDDVTIDLAEPMSFSYVVVNNGHADQAQILAALAAAGNGLGLAGTTSMEEDIAKGVVKFVEVKLTGVLSLSIPVLGSILGAVESWLLDKLNDIIFVKCDGLVAVEMRAMMGRDLFLLTDSGTKTFTTVTTHQGTDSATGCGANSIYEVTWTIKPL